MFTEISSVMPSQTKIIIVLLVYFYFYSAHFGNKLGLNCAKLRLNWASLLASYIEFVLKKKEKMC